jgi:hypothetical protein
VTARQKWHLFAGVFWPLAKGNAHSSADYLGEPVCVLMILRLCRDIVAARTREVAGEDLSPRVSITRSGRERRAGGGVYQ